MFFEKFKLIFYLLIAILGSFLLHKLLFYFLQIKLNTAILNFTLEELYIIFGIFSTLITTTSILLKQKNIDLVGNVFMLLTSIKMIICFVIMKQYNSNSDFDYSLEKYNYLTLFLLFLVLETSATIYILNKNEN